MLVLFEVLNFVYSSASDSYDLSPSEKLLYIAMARSVGQNEFTWMSQAMLAKQMHMSDRHIRELLSSLEDKKLIRQDHFIGKSSHRYITLPIKTPVLECSTTPEPQFLPTPEPQFLPTPEPQFRLKSTLQSKRQSSYAESQEKEQKMSKNKTEIPYQEIMDSYHELLPDNPRMLSWTAQRKGFMNARWEENEEVRSLDWWRGFFQHIADNCGFLTGKTEHKATFNLEWIIRPNNFTKIREGHYER